MWDVHGECSLKDMGCRFEHKPKPISNPQQHTKITISQTSTSDNFEDQFQNMSGDNTATLIVPKTKNKQVPKAPMAGPSGVPKHKETFGQPTKNTPSTVQSKFKTSSSQIPTNAPPKLQRNPQIRLV